MDQGRLGRPILRQQLLGDLGGQGVERAADLLAVGTEDGLFSQCDFRLVRGQDAREHRLEVLSFECASEAFQCVISMSSLRGLCVV